MRARLLEPPSPSCNNIQFSMFDDEEEGGWQHEPDDWWHHELNEHEVQEEQHFAILPQTPNNKLRAVAVVKILPPKLTYRRACG